MQAIADQRRQVVRGQYDRFRTSYAGASASLDTLLKDLHDLRSVIGNDLTEATQSQVRGTTVVQSAASDGSRARPAIDAALTDTRAHPAVVAGRRPVIGNCVPGSWARNV